MSTLSKFSCNYMLRKPMVSQALIRITSESIETDHDPRTDKWCLSSGDRSCITTTKIGQDG